MSISLIAAPEINASITEGDTTINVTIEDHLGIGISLISGQGPAGVSPRAVELQNNSIYIQWRYVGEEDWTNLISIEDLRGNTGPQGNQGNQGDIGQEIELQATETTIQWKYNNESNWRDLIPLNNLRGYQGFQGTQGTQGTQGVQGNQGNQGQIGVGNQGVPGVQGDQGQQGYQGYQGFQGTKGDTGSQGNQGNQGNQGSQGLTGSGTQGVPGTQGNQGNQGNQGYQGSVGTGTQGNQGNQGNVGSQGNQGNQGDQGYQGLTGSGTQGNQGYQGNQGNQGAQGSGSGAAITVKDEGTTLTSSLASIDFVGTGVTATNIGDAVTVTISSSGISGITDIPDTNTGRIPYSNGSTLTDNAGFTFTSEGLGITVTNAPSTGGMSLKNSTATQYASIGVLNDSNNSVQLGVYGTTAPNNPNKGFVYLGGITAPDFSFLCWDNNLSKVISLLDINVNGTIVIPGTLTGKDNILTIPGVLSFTGNYTTDFISPVGAHVPTKINIPVSVLPEYGAVLDFGAAEGSDPTAKVLSIFDARTGNHQPSLQVASPNENYGIGFSWDGQNDVAFLKTNAHSIAFKGSDNYILGAIFYDFGNGVDEFAIYAPGDVTKYAEFKINSSGNLAISTNVGVINIPTLALEFTNVLSTGQLWRIPYGGVTKLVCQSGFTFVEEANLDGTLTVPGALTLSGTHTTSFHTPAGSDVPTKINIPVMDPGAFGQIIIAGLPSFAPTSARAFTFADARTVDHQPTLGVFSPGENDLGGFSWEGTGDFFFLKTMGGKIGFKIGSSVFGAFETNSTYGKALRIYDYGGTSSDLAADSGGNLNIIAYNFVYTRSPLYVANGLLRKRVIATDNISLANTTCPDIVEMSVAEKTVTFPSASGSNTDRIFMVDNSSSGDVYLASNGGTFNGQTSVTLATGLCVQYQSNGTDWRLMSKTG